MKKKLLGICPVCSVKLTVTELSCKECGTTIHGDFKLSKFDYLSDELQNFALVFLKNGGNIKAVENELNISYPTVKKLLENVIEGLDFSVTKVNAMLPTRESILKRLRAGEIGFDEAEQLLKEIGE